MKTDEAVRHLLPVITGIRRALHAIPEPAYAENKTCRYILKMLDDLGIPSRVVAGTGIIADIDSGKKGMTVAVRADMDALPVEEKTDLDFVSEHPGYMHACGHDGHMAIVLGLAMTLLKRRDEMGGTVRLIFQPAEEKPPRGGADLMIREGALDVVDRVVGFHILPHLACGTASVTAGSVMAAADEFEITVRGSGGHASAPEKTQDTILVAAKIVDALNCIASRMVSPLEPFVLSCGEIHGGNAFNIIPDSVVIRGTVRTFAPGLRSDIPHLMRQILDGVTRAFNTTYEFEYIQCYPPVVNDAKSADYVRTIVESCLGGEHVVAMEPLMGSEDFSRYLEQTRGCYFFLGGAKPGTRHSLHSPSYDFDEAVLEHGVRCLTRIVLNSALWK